MTYVITTYTDYFHFKIFLIMSKIWNKLVDEEAISIFLTLSLFENFQISLFTIDFIIYIGKEDWFVSCKFNENEINDRK